MKWFCYPLLAVGLLFSFSLQAQTVRVGNDLNGDGISDLVNIEITSGGALDWSIISGSDLLALDSFDQSGFGQVGNHVVMAKWFSTSQARLAYARVRNSRIIWAAAPSSGKIRKKAFGTQSDLVISGGDFNGNGYADAALIRTLADGSFNWIVAPDIFKRATPLVSLRHGKQGDTPFFASYAGSRDWLGVIRAKSSTDYRMYLRRAYGRSTRTVSLGAIPAGSLRPLPLPQDRGGDLLAFAKRSASSTTVVFVNMRGQVLGQVSIPGTGEILAGNFLPASGSEIAVMGNGWITVYNPVTEEELTQTWEHDIVADHININSFESDDPDQPIATPSPTPQAPRDNPAPPQGSLSEVCTNLHSMNRQVLYKPGSGGTNDSRTGKPAFLWYDAVDNPHVSTLYVLASNGRQIAIFGLYNFGYPMTRYYSGYAPGTFDTASSLSAKAMAQTGRRTLYFYTENGNCWGPVPDPGGRSGGR